MLTIYVFGNQDVEEDSLPFLLQSRIKLKKQLKDIDFVVVKPNEDLPFVNKEKVVVMDVVKGLKKVSLLTEKDLDRLKLSPRSTVHDFDLAWQLKYLMKLGKLKEVRIIGIPMEGDVNIARVTEMIEALK